MTQVVFKVGQQVNADTLNLATQGYKFLRRTTYAGSAGSPTGNGLTFTATWFVGSGTSALFVRVCGAGGGSQAARGGNTSPTITCGVGASGGGGGYSEKWIPSGIGSSQVVTVGLGGNTGTIPSGPGNGGESKFAGFLSAGGGLFSPAIFWDTQGTVFAPGGAGGIGSGGNINAAGSYGGVSAVYATNFPISGLGGQSAFGGAGGPEIIVMSNGGDGSLYGGGASGAVVTATSTLQTRNGGKGAPGFVMVDEYA